jgi:GTP cyclohydrolase II
MKGPFRAAGINWVEEAEAAMELARIAGILPAFLVAPDDAEEAVYCEAGDLEEWSDSDRLVIATRARLPITASEQAEIVAFRKLDDMREHVAIVVGEPNFDFPPLVRLHSECLTGDIFGSLKCDCGPQLDGALGKMADHAREEAGWGVLLYLRQEGRGIGIINKLRAYRLQDAGFDTLEANRRLGLPDEARDFPVAGRMLELLGIPQKVAALEESGIRVIERVEHKLPANPHNERYLATKRDDAGHLL